MALVKIFAKQQDKSNIFSNVSQAVKLVTAAALNVPELPTTPGSVETVYIEAIDIVGIDYILEIIAVKRPNQQQIAEQIITGLNEIYPEKLFSVYFNTISESGMANTPRKHQPDASISMDEAIERSKR